MATRSSVRAATDAVGARRREILAVGMELFAESGYHGTSIRDIAEACDLQPASLYSHFENKEEVLRGIVTQYLEALRPALEAAADGDGDGRTRLVALFETAVRVGYAHRLEFLILDNDWNHIKRTPGLASVVELTRSCQAVWIRVLKAGMADGTLRSDVAAAQVLRLLLGAVAGLVDTRYDDLGGAQVRRGAKAASLLLEGLAAPTA